MVELLALCALTWAGGFTAKLVDAHHEHGLDFFPHAGLLFAIAAGLIWGYVMTRSAILLTGFMGLMFFWIYRLAWDCVNHAIILILILLFALSSVYRIDSGYAIAILFGYVLLHHLKIASPSPRWKAVHAFFYKYRLDVLLIPSVYSLFVGTQGFVVCFTSLGVIAANKVFHIPRHVILPNKQI